MKLLICISCEAEFQLKHFMEKRFYIINYCPFCGEEFSQDEEFEDNIEWIEEEYYDD
jgi:hypothetical protein|tara:strand:- start:1543 stop:1713 length:171 start_codon:yes stop_codon:yes gene_type:complete